MARDTPRSSERKVKKPFSRPELTELTDRPGELARVVRELGGEPPETDDPGRLRQTVAELLCEGALVACLACSGLAVGGCSGGSSPTEPAPRFEAARVQALTTRVGTLAVHAHDCGERLDLAAIGAEIHTTAGVADRQNPGLEIYDRLVLDGFEIHARSPARTRSHCPAGGGACFERAGDVGRLHVWCGSGGVEHETAHAIAWAAGLPCWRDVYHGVDFRCEPG